jgi:hypothetical protein
MNAWKELELAAPWPRLALGIYFLVLGVLKFTAGLGAQAALAAERFGWTVIPGGAVKAFALSLGPLEVVLGLVLLAGICRKWTLLASATLLLVLLLGKLIFADYPMIAFYAVLILLNTVALAVLPFDPCGLEPMMKKKGTA